MHLVFLNQYYPPDAAPTGVMLEAVVEELARQGYSVTVICAAGGYAGGGGDFEQRTSDIEHRAEEGCNGAGVTAASIARPSALDDQPTSSIIRLPALKFGRGTFAGKLLDYASFYLGVAWRLMTLRSRPDRIVALTTPPYLSVLARLASKARGGDHAHWVMDLYPDVMAAHGMLRETNAIYRVLANVARWGFGGRRSAALLTLGPDMAERLDQLARGGGKAARRTAEGHQPTVDWIPLWGGECRADQPATIPDPGFRRLRQQRGWGDDEMVVMYSGNMGLGHRFGEILEVAEQAAHDKKRPVCRFVFFGGGKRRGEVKAFFAAHPGAAVELHDYAPAGLLMEHLQSADVHFVSLEDLWTGTMVPSKLQGIFAACRPVIFIGCAESSIGRWVRESGGGWVVGQGDVAGLRAALTEAANLDVREDRGRAALAFARTYFDKATNVARVAESLAKERTLR